MALTAPSPNSVGPAELFDGPPEKRPGVASPLGVMRPSPETGTICRAMALKGLADAACSLTAGDLARWLSVDLKTIHNWVRRGYLVGRRTTGGHRRFYRTEVIRFLRQAGWYVPSELREPAPRVALVGDLEVPPRSTSRKLRAVRLALKRLGNPFQAILQIADGEFEIVILSLGAYLEPFVEDFVRALRKHQLTQGVVPIGVSPSKPIRRAFVNLGIDIVVTHEEELARTILWLTDAGPRPDELGNSDRPPTLRRAGNQIRPARPTSGLSAPLGPTT